MGGNVRVGLEENQYLAKREYARSNAVLVQRMREILNRLSLTIATPSEVRERLQLKGKTAVRF